MNPSDVPLFSPSKMQSQSGFSSTQPASPDPFGSYLAKCKENAETVVPQPLECLYGTQIPPFLSKTFDLVEDLCLDTIISWGSEGVSFVVWDPLEFSRLVLPQNFKHNNFSSFVRQLNTYGFRKIDTDRWEFANEHFIQGKRHLLKSIQRRRSPQTQHMGTFFAGCSVELGKEELETELEKLKKGKSLIMRDVVELQKQQRGYERHMEAVNEKLVVTERRQKKMVSFLAKLFQNREFSAHRFQKKKQRPLTSERKVEFIKHQNEPYKLDSPDFGSITKNPDLDSPIQEISEFLLQSNRENTVQDVVPCHTESAIDKVTDVALPKIEVYHNFVSFPEEMGKERNFVELPSLGSGNVIKQEDFLNFDFGDGAGMPSSRADLLGNFSNYDDVSELGFDGCFSDLWDSGLWPADDSPLKEVGGIENKMI